MKIPNGFYCEDSIRWHLEKVFAGEYEVPLKFERPAVILDIGANVGAFALWAADRWPGAVIHCYEPHPVTHGTLLSNLSLTKERIFANNFAVGPAGRATLHEGIHNSGEATLFGGNQVSSGVTHEVEVRSPLTLPDADIIKIDAEGSEVDILRPLIEAGRHFSAIMFEYHRVDDRRLLDTLLRDYILTGAAVTPNPHLGVVRYLHRSFLTDLMAQFSLKQEPQGDT